MISGIAAAAEEKLREACAQVFDGVGESLRERLRRWHRIYAADGTSYAREKRQHRKLKPKLPAPMTALSRGVAFRPDSPVPCWPGIIPKVPITMANHAYLRVLDARFFTRNDACRIRQVPDDRAAFGHAKIPLAN